MANLSPLTPIGFDIPQYNAGVNATQAPQNLPQTDTTGLQALSQSGQQTQQTLQQQQQNAAIQAKAVADIANSNTQSVQAISQAAAQASQMRASRSSNNLQSLGNLSDSVLKYANQYNEYLVKKDQAAAKAMQDAQQSAATKDLEDLRVDWIEQGKIDTNGTAAYRDAVASTLGRYALNAADVTTLTQQYYSPALDYAKRTESNRQSTAEDVVKQQRRITVEGYKGKLSTDLGALAASAGLPQSVVDTHYANLQTSAGELLKNETVPFVDRLTAYADGLETLNSTMKDRNMQVGKINADLINVREVMSFAMQQQAKLRNNEIGIEEYNGSITQMAMSKNLPGFNVPDPNSAEKYQKDVLSTAASIKQLKNEEAISKLEAINADQNVIGALVTQFALDAASYENAKADPNAKHDRNATAAIAVFEDFKKFRDAETPAYNSRQQGFKTTMNAKSAQFDQWFLNAQRASANGQAVARDPTFAKLLEAARMGDPSLASIPATGSAPLTQDEVDRMQASYTSQINATSEEAGVSRNDYQNRQAQFAKYGLSLDINETRASNKMQQAALQKYRQQADEIRASSAKATAQPGASPNFNGGAPGKSSNWKPLGRSNYNGASTITFPFSQGVTAEIGRLQQGQAFGDRRPYGGHTGLDFGVVKGTSVLSLVYGTVTKVVSTNEPGYGLHVEVKGDDGLTYLYGHLNKTQVVEGQRIGAGQPLALSGNSGGNYADHLHLGVYAKDGSALDPMVVLSSKQFGDTAKQPRSSGAQRPTDLPPTIPVGAIPLGGNSYLMNGKVIRAEYLSYTNVRQTIAKYSAANPVRNSYAGGSKTTAHGNDPIANHGYDALAKDKPFAKALNAEAERQGIPGEWLADLISVESANTFSPTIDNGLGYTGLIQFGSSALQDLGITRNQLVSMTPTQQMKYVGKYLDLQKRYAGVDKFRNVAELVAAVNQGHTVLRDVRQRGEAAVNDSSNQDGAGVTLKMYLGMLGKYGGRQYDYAGNRNARASTVIHTRTITACTFCNSLQAQAAFVPHEGQIA